MLPSDMLVIVTPAGSGGGSGPRGKNPTYFTVDVSVHPLEKVLLASERVASFQSLLDALNVVTRSTEINARSIWFVDAPTFLGKWRTWPGLGTFRGHSLVYDLNHPFSQILVNWCTNRLPRLSSLLIDDLLPEQSFRIFDRQILSEDINLSERQQEALQQLKEDGIVPKEIELHETKDWEVETHKCPYGASHNGC
jgi:hypothetical protein